MTTTNTLLDPNTPDDVIREAMAGAANRVVAAYMRQAQAASTPQEKENAKAHMQEYWDLKNNLDMPRHQMIKTTVHLWDMLPHLEEA